MPLLPLWWVLGACAPRSPLPQPVPPSPPEARLTAEAFARDLDLLVAHLEEIHPAPFHGTTPEAFAAHVAELRAEGGPWTVPQAYRALAGLLATVGDTHTSVFPPEAGEDPVAAARFPAEVTIGADGALVARTSGGPISTGDRIVAIGGEPTRQAVDRWRSHTSGDTPESRDARVARRLSTYLGLDGLGPPFSVTVDGDPPRTLAVDGIAPPPEIPLTFSLGEDGIGRLELLATWDPALVEPLLDDAFSRLQAARAKGLIVDLRHHQGGSLEVADRVLGRLTDRPYRFASRRERRVSAPMQAQMASEGGDPAYLEARPGEPYVETFEAAPPPPGPRFSGPVAFLIGPMGHVTTALFVAAVADCDLATIIGQPLGELPTNYSESYWLTLPDSGLEAAIASSRYVRPGGEADPGPIVPDIALPAEASEEEVLAEARRWIGERASGR